MFTQAAIISDEPCIFAMTDSKQPMPSPGALAGIQAMVMHRCHGDVVAFDLIEGESTKLNLLFRLKLKPGTTLAEARALARTVEKIVRLEKFIETEDRARRQGNAKKPDYVRPVSSLSA